MIKLNYKYLNILLLLGNCYLLFLLKNVWLEAVLKIFNILFPFILGFCLSYAFYPLVRVINKKIPKVFSIIIVLTAILFLIILTLYYTLPLIFSSISNLFYIIEKNIMFLGDKYNIDIDTILNFVIKHSNKIIDFFTKTNNIGLLINHVSKSAEYITIFITTFISFIYFLFDMDNIRKKVKTIFRDKKIFNLIKNIDKELTYYLKGFLIFTIVQFIEYTLVFLFIGHPSYLLIGFLASITGIIPYFGGILTNVIALVLAATISKKLLVLTGLVLIILPNIDEYIISPKIYNRTNKISPLLQIFSIFLFGSLFGFLGLVISMPATIIISVIIKEYKENIIAKIKSVKEKL